MIELKDDVPYSVYREVYRILIGDKIGSGSRREVYEYAPDPTRFVVKVECDEQSFQNIKEWETWQSVKDTKYARWFAPCHTIGPNGIVLIQRRSFPAERYPARMPAFLCDFKTQNYGLIDGKFVCHDYGIMTCLANFGLTKRMVSAKWWDGNSR